MTSSSSPSPSRGGSKTFPLIPLTKEFMSMLGTKDEKAIYALKPVFATRCERVSSTNKLLERAILFSQSGTLRLVDTADGRITHTLELGEQRNLDWNISVTADREKDPKTHTHGVRILVDKTDNSRAAFDNMDEVAQKPEELVLQFHCARAPVAVNFVAMLRHFAAIKGINENFTMRLQTDSVVEETVSSRGSLDILSNKFSAARKSSFMSSSPERRQSLADEARKQKKATEKRGETIEVLAPAVVPSVREQQKREREDAARKVREKEEAAQRAAELAAEEAAAQARAAAAVEAEEQEIRKREILAGLSSSSGGGGAAAQSGQVAPEELATSPAPHGYDSDEDTQGSARRSALATPPVSTSAPLLVADDAYGETSIDNKADVVQAPQEANGEAPVPQVVEPISTARSGPSVELAVASGEAAAEVTADPSIGTDAAAAAAAAGATAATAEDDSAPVAQEDDQQGKNDIRAILQGIRRKPNQEGGDAEIANDAEHHIKDEEDEELDDQPMDEDAFIDSLSAKEAQEVVSGIMNSIEELKDEQEQLILEREALHKSLRELSSVTLCAEHALGLANIIWSICDIKLVRHFSR